MNDIKELIHVLGGNKNTILSSFQKYFIKKYRNKTQ